MLCILYNGSITMCAQQLRTGFMSIPEVNTPISVELINKIDNYCRYFETRGENGLALNTPYLGVHQISFTRFDRDLFYATVEVEESVIKAVIRKVDYISPSWNVLGDPMNHLIIYLAHRTITSKLTAAEIDKGLLALFKILHYKLFTSLLFKRFEHGANPDIMEAVVNSLSKKFDLIAYKTWKGVIEARSRAVFDAGSDVDKDALHLTTLQNYDDDKKICYVISDIQTRLRNKINLITEQYYKFKESGDRIASYGHVDTIDGEKVIADSSNVMDSMLSSMLVECQNPSRFIENELIQVLSTKFQYVNEDAMRSILIRFAELGSVQAQSGELQKVVKPRGQDEYYVGVGILVRELLQKTYRLCQLDKVNMNSKGAILTKVMNIYTSSRITDDNVIKIKRSFYNFVLTCGESRRESTNASLAIAMILYIMIRSFRYL